MDLCSKCLREQCNNRITGRCLCWKYIGPANERICEYLSPECNGESKHDCGYWDGVCKCPQETMKSTE